VVVKPQPLIISEKGINRERSYLRNLCKKILLIIITRKLLRGNTKCVKYNNHNATKQNLLDVNATAHCGRGHMQPEKKFSLKGENVVNCLEFRETCHLHACTLVKADPPKKRHKSNPGTWLSPRCNLTGASRSLSSITCTWKKFVWYKNLRGVCLVGRHNSSRVVNSFHLAIIYLNTKKPRCRFFVITFFDLLGIQLE